MGFFQRIISYILILLSAILPSTTHTEGVVGQPNSFLPSQLTQREDKTVSQLLYRGLFKYDIYGTLVPDLAETWILSDDGIVYTIKLKDDQRWTDGKKITSDDLIYTSFMVPDLTGVSTDKIDELTVRYTLPNKYSPFLNLLTIGIMPADAETTNNPLKPVSSGDFAVGRVEKRGDAVKKIVIVNRNNDHEIGKIVFRYYSNEDELEIAAKLGEIDSFLTRDTYDIENFENYRFPLQGIYYALFFNLREEKLQNIELRTSLEKVLPVEDMIVHRGIAVQGAISRNLFTDESLIFDKHDPEFNAHLEDVSITLTIPDVEIHTSFAKEIKQVWEDDLDIDVTIRKIDSEEMLEKVIAPRKFEVLLYGQEVGRDPDRYEMWHSTQKKYPGLNITGLEHVRVDRALEEGRNENMNEKRVVHYDGFQRVVNEEVPVIFLYHPYMNYYVKNHTTGIGEKYTFTESDRFLDFANWKRLTTN